VHFCAQKTDIEVGEKVLISISKQLYDKGFTGYWRRDEPFTVAGIRQGVPNKTYVLRDENGELIKGAFYREQILPIPTPPQTPLKPLTKKKKNERQ
jgi:hypothetical protein